MEEPLHFIMGMVCYRQMGLLDMALDVATKGVKALPSFSPGYAILGRIQVQPLGPHGYGLDLQLVIPEEGQGHAVGWRFYGHRSARLRQQPEDGIDRVVRTEQRPEFRPGDKVRVTNGVITRM